MKTGGDVLYCTFWLSFNDGTAGVSILSYCLWYINVISTRLSLTWGLIIKRFEFEMSCLDIGLGL